jgi:hypothetical protein
MRLSLATWLFALFCTAGVLDAASPALAQNDIMKVIRGSYEKQRRNLFDFNFGFGRSSEPEPRLQPQRPSVQIKPRKQRARVSPFAAPRPSSTVVQQAKPVVPPSIFVHVLGDSLAEMLADGLKAQLEDRPDIAVIKDAKSSSGFVRTDYHDWTAATADLLASSEKVDAVVMMIGSNDRQQLRENGSTHDLRSEGWRAAYAKRIDSLLTLLKAKGVKTFWVGLPPTKNEKLSADMVWFNEIYRERAEAAGATYLDIWDSFVDANGLYAASGPDLNGQVAKLRAPDGINFSKAGARLAAHYVERELRRAFGEASAAVTPSATVPLATEDAGRSAVSGTSVSALGPIISPTDEGDEAGEPEKPEFGPVMPLQQVEASSDGRLLGGGLPQAPSKVVSTASPPATSAATLADPTAAKVLTRGEALIPKEGRADDYRWPRPASAQEPLKTSSRPLPSL